MFQFKARVNSLSGRLRALFARRAVPVLLALLIEALLVLLMLTLGYSNYHPEKKPGSSLVSLRFLPGPQEERAKPEQAARQTRQAPRPAEQKPEPQPEQPPAKPAPLPPPLINLSREQMAMADIAPRPLRSAAPAAPNRAQYGPVDTGSPGDTARVGSAPNGQPLYAAAWYREPSDDELRGYLSTATGPGWGLIACRTAPDYRVEDCVALDEYPGGSNINRAVLAAAWQFRVRPPRIGGRVMVGEWVRIRIDYGIRRR